MGERDEVKLLGAWYSPYLLRPKIALRLKSVAYDYEEQNLFGPKSNLLLRSNPVHKKIPVLIHNGKPVCESLVIVQYIDEVWNSSGPSILPAHPYDRAIARFWASFIDEKWFPAFKAAARAKSEDARTEAMKEVNEGLINIEEAFVSISKGKPFFGGDKIGFLDIVFGSFMVVLRAGAKVKGVKHLIDDITTPSLYKWVEKFLSDEVVKSVVPETDKLVEFLVEFEGRLGSGSRS